MCSKPSKTCKSLRTSHAFGILLSWLTHTRKQTTTIQTPKTNSKHFHNLINNLQDLQKPHQNLETPIQNLHKSIKIVQHLTFIWNSAKLVENTWNHTNTTPTPITFSTTLKNLLKNFDASQAPKPFQNWHKTYSTPIQHLKKPIPDLQTPVQPGQSVQKPI